jgi:hypothetical protein
VDGRSQHRLSVQQGNAAARVARVHSQHQHTREFTSGKEAAAKMAANAASLQSFAQDAPVQAQPAPHPVKHL